MTDVSIIIPIYQGSKWIRECINSVLQQDFDDLEVIAVDDASPDDTANIVASMEDERIRLFRHDENKGIPAARNTGIKQANGDYVAFLDQDDKWYNHKLGSQIEVFEQGPENLGVVHGDVDIVGGDKNISNGEPVPENDKKRVQSTFLQNPIITITALIDSECFETHGLLNENLYGADDYEFWLRIAERYQFKYCPGVVATKRVHESNTSDNFKRMNPDKIMITKQYVEKYPYLQPLENQRCHRIMTHYARNYANMGEYVQALQYDIKSLSYIKTNPSDYLRLSRDLMGFLYTTIMLR